MEDGEQRVRQVGRTQGGASGRLPDLASGHRRHHVSLDALCCGGGKLYALDTQNGTVFWQHTLRTGRGYANPITYRAANGTQYIVIAPGAGNDCALVAFSIDGK